MGATTSSRSGVFSAAYRAFRKCSGAVVVALTAAVPLQALAQQAICYNCIPEWADWGTQLKTIKSTTGITVPPDNKNSGQALAQMIAERASPVADFSYMGVTFAIQAKALGITSPYKPAGWDEVPAGLKDPDGHWIAAHLGTPGIVVNVAALKGRPVPRSYADLLKPEYKGMVGTGDPGSTFAGYVSAVSINTAMGGTLDNFDPAIRYYQKLLKNDAIVINQAPYARMLSGELPITTDFDFSAYQAKYRDHANVVFVIPQEGTIVVPYVLMLTQNSRNAANGRKVVDYLLSNTGQGVWANANMRPARPSAMSAEAKSRFLPDSEYARAVPVNYEKMAEAQKKFADRFNREAK